MISYKKNRIVIILLLFFNTVYSQHLPSKNFTVNDGLPSNGIKCFYRDSRGLMWIGTESGLCCYDGSTFKIYNETNGLKFNEVWSIAEDKSKNLWLSVYGNGLAKFDGKNFTYYNTTNGLINNCIRKIVYSNKYNCLLLGTENGLSIFDGKHFKSFVGRDSIRKFQVVGLSEKDSEVIVTVSYSDLFRLKLNIDINNARIEKIFKPSLILYSAYEKNGVLYAGSSSEYLLIHDLKNNKEFKVSCPITWDFVCDNENNIYAAAWNVNNPSGGLFKISNKKVVDLTQKYNINSNGLWCLYFDKFTNQLWVGSVDKGVFIIDLSNQFKLYNSSYFNSIKLDIQCLLIDSFENKWIGSSNKILIFHKDSSISSINSTFLWKKINEYFSKNGLYPYTKEIYEYHLNKKTFLCFNIVSDQNKNIWIATSLGIFCFDKNLKLLYFNFSDGGHISVDNNNNVFYGEMYSDLFISHLYNRTNRVRISIHDKNIPRDITKIITDKNCVWFSSYSSGLYCFENNKFISLNKIGQFFDKHINCILINNKGELLIGTNFGKVYIAKWREAKLKILHEFYPNIDLYGSSVSFIEYSKDYYFIGTNKGINIIKNNKLIKFIDQSEGLSDIQFNDCAKDKNGNLWIAQPNGLLFLDVNLITQINTFKDSIIIAAIKINGIDKTDSLSKLFLGNNSSQSIILNYNQNDIEINFNNINLINANKNVYRYKIIGLTNNWSEYDNSKKINLRGLPIGRFILVIEGKNLGTGRCFNTLRITIDILPPFWKTTWFEIIVFISSISLFFIIYKRRIKYLQSKLDLQKRLAETKMEALQSQMNPHFVFNSLNSIQNYIIKNDIDEALLYLSEFSKLIRQTLIISSQSKITLKLELEYLQSYFNLENKRFNNKVHLIFNLPTNLDINLIELPPLLIQPFVENAFVHAFDSNSLNPTITISFSISNSILLCQIEDNGKGISSDKFANVYSSKGIKLVKDRLSLFQSLDIYSLKINSNSYKGTTVMVSILLN